MSFRAATLFVRAPVANCFQMAFSHRRHTVADPNLIERVTAVAELLGVTPVTYQQMRSRQQGTMF
jgi:hypothetical protein